MVSKGIKESEIVFESVIVIEENKYITTAAGNSYAEFEGYKLHQNVIIESKDLDKVESASREISDLLGKGIELSS